MDHVKRVCMNGRVTEYSNGHVIFLMGVSLPVWVCLIVMDMSSRGSTVHEVPQVTTLDRFHYTYVHDVS